MLSTARSAPAGPLFRLLARGTLGGALAALVAILVWWTFLAGPTGLEGQKPPAPEVEMIVRDIRTETEHAEQVVPYTTQRVENGSLWAGQSRTTQSGRPGKLQVTYRRTYENGQLVRGELFTAELLRPPLPRLVEYGTAGRISLSGSDFRYVQELEMKATAYAVGDGMTPGTHTFLGLPAQRGVVAVDPTVIPLGTRLYIEGYGEALAADTGSAIKGNIIDLCFDTVAEVIAYGVRRVKVYILDN